VCNIKKNETRRKKEKYKKGSTNTYTSVWLIEEDLRARLPVLFEGTKYEESNYTGKLYSFSNDGFYTD